MNKFLRLAATLIVTIFLGMFVLLTPTYANSVCDGSPACIPTWVQYCWTRTFECSTYPGGPSDSFCTDQQCEMREVCSIPQSGGESCTCCWNDGCYLSCSGPTPTGGGGGGGGGGASCGDGSCDASESCSTCPSDCGACSPPPVCQNMYYCRTSDYTCQQTSSQYSTTFPYPICGNTTPYCSTNLNTYLPGQTTGTCYTSLSTCQFSCIAPPGTVQMRAAVVPSGTTSCSTVTSSTNYTTVGITLFPDGTTKTTSGTGAYSSATWNPSNPEDKSFIDVPPAGYVLALACYNKTSQPGYLSGYTASLPTAETLTWQLGYTAGVGWFQAQGGDVYAASTLRSYIPVLASGGRYFVANGTTGGVPGTVTYGTGATYDFDNTSGNGAGYVSTKNWLVNESQSSTDYYAVMYHRFGSPTTPNYSGTTTLSSKLASQVEPYYVDGDLTIDTPGNWTVGNNETITVLVNGDLTINNRINITGTGFVAFIVNGNITISSSVGTTATSSTPVLEGIYITSPAGAFRTSASTTAAARKFVGKGTFVAGTFTLERDLDADTRNIDYPAELFIYNPELMLRMPEKMKDLPVSWSEVAP